MTVRMFISTGKPVPVTIMLISESLACHFPLLNKLKHNEKKKFDGLTEQFETLPKQEHVAEGLQEIGGD